MSLDAGGLAQMTYNYNPFNNGLGVPGSGFASRGKASHIKRLSFAPPANISTINESNQPQPIATPRTSRSHLLAGLRTAPKSPSVPISAPPTQLHHRHGLENNKYAMADQAELGRQMPQTATNGNFPSLPPNYHDTNNHHIYSYPEQVLAPPDISGASDLGESQRNPKVYAELVAKNQFLAQQQARLQQQLRDLTAATQRRQEMEINEGGNYQQQYGQPQMSLMTPNMSFYSQQLQNGLQPIIQEVPNYRGVYSVYNPMTGQSAYFIDQATQQGSFSPPATTPAPRVNYSPPTATPTFRAQVSPPPESGLPLSEPLSDDPVKKSSSPPRDVTPLPPPSSNAFRRGHQKALSSISGLATAPLDGPKTGMPKSMGFPQTPLTGTFGPGQSRAGEHPIRQPRGPPELSELIAKPTTKFEGSKNFAARQRRKAVKNLVRAGMERRGASRGKISPDDFDSMTPVSEGDIAFSVPSDNDSDSGASGKNSLSSKPSVGSLRAAANGAVGSERREIKERSRERGSIEGNHWTTNLDTEGSNTSGDRSANGKTEQVLGVENERKKTPFMVLGNAEKRKSSLF